MYSQQILRQEWHGDVSWHKKPTLFKIFYVFKQTFCTPIYIVIALICNVGRDIHEMNNGVLPEVNERSSMFKRYYIKFLQRTTNINLNLDVPFNRFVSFSGHYRITCNIYIFTYLALICKNRIYLCKTRTRLKMFQFLTMF